MPVANSRQSHEARALLARGAAILVDVRTPDEYGERHIPGAINIPVQELSYRTGELDRGRVIVVYCRSGNRSATAAQILRGAGHDVLDVGSIHDW
jgi:rhodanese-related sulfurtransferase